MEQTTIEPTLVSQPGETPTRLALDDGSRIGVIGGGPAGSFFAYFLLDMADRVGMDLQVDIYEPRDFASPGPPGCNMCGGIVSESLVQMLAAEGINLPSTVVQRGIDAYTLHMDVGSVRIETPLHEKRIGAVYRGSGPRDLKEVKWEGLDGHLQKLAVEKGTAVIRQRVAEVDWVDGHPQIITRGGSSQVYDLVAVTAGVTLPSIDSSRATNWRINHPEQRKPSSASTTWGQKLSRNAWAVLCTFFCWTSPGWNSPPSSPRAIT